MRSAALLVLWTLLVLYPNPAQLAQSAARAWSPPVDPEAVAALAAALPDDPRAIEHAVNTSIVPYAVPWQTYGVPWYFPTVEDVLRAGQGDCQARAVVFASLLEAKGIRYSFVGSLDHLWIEYPGKQATAAENTAVAIAEQQPNGRYRLRWPALHDWRASWDIERAYFWDSMPASRLWVLAIGWVVVSVRSRLRAMLALPVRLRRAALPVGLRR